MWIGKMGGSMNWLQMRGVARFLKGGGGGGSKA